jgi:predicted nucleic acid-binding protein
LATAVAANADDLVTGDRRLLEIGRFRAFAIVLPRQFVAFLDDVPRLVS